MLGKNQRIRHFQALRTKRFQACQMGFGRFLEHPPGRQIGNFRADGSRLLFRRQRYSQVFEVIPIKPKSEIRNAAGMPAHLLDGLWSTSQMFDVRGL